MSVQKGEMVYVCETDFAKHYPWFSKWGYEVSYEIMGLWDDHRVPVNAKWAFYAKHMDNMRWKFAPNDGYEWLHTLVASKDFFVLTSIVDGCFERAGLMLAAWNGSICNA
jgi:NAD-dependent SIR2 family protein deacetylase